jgi:hypothetical protein
VIFKAAKPMGFPKPNGSGLFGKYVIALFSNHLAELGPQPGPSGTFLVKVPMDSTQVAQISANLICRKFKCAEGIALTILLTLAVPICLTPCRSRSETWRRDSESNAAFTDNQPQYPDLRGYFKADFTGVQAVSNTTRQPSNLTLYIPTAHTDIEVIVEGFLPAGLVAATVG